MDGTSQGEIPAGTLSLLPPEIRRLILYFLPDLSALRNAILSHSCLYGVFAENKDYILRSIVLSYVTPELYSVALSVHEASKVEPRTQEKFLDILACYDNADLCPPHRLSFHDSASLLSMHSHVSFFTQRFIASTLSTHAPAGNTETPTVSSREWRRVAHNFYLYELYYCQVFRYSFTSASQVFSEFDKTEQKKILRERHPFWEIEQQTCIYEYLYRELSKVYNHLAYHDIKWHRVVQGGYSDLEAWESNGDRKVNMLQSGLAFIRSFITVDSFEEGLKIIYSKAEIRRPPPPYRKWLSYDPHHDQAMLKEYSLEKIESLIYPSFLMDLDNGPAEAWRWTFASEYSVSFGYNPRTRELRRSGYIMWDYARLVDWGFFQGDWVPPSLDRSPDDVKREQAYRRAQSWKETWCTGAKGWWSAGDQSQVTFWGRAPSGFGESIPYEEAYEDDLLFAR